MTESVPIRDGLYGAVRDATGSVNPRARYAAGAAVSIANGASDYLKWGSLEYGDDTIVNLSDPAAPFVTKPGVYALSVQVSQVMTVAGSFTLALVMRDLRTYWWSSVTTVADPAISGLTATMTSGMFAGDPIYLYITSYDGAASQDFSFDELGIQRIW